MNKNEFTLTLKLPCGPCTRLRVKENQKETHEILKYCIFDIKREVTQLEPEVHLEAYLCAKNSGHL